MYQWFSVYLFDMNLKYNETTHFQNIPDRPIENDPDPKYFFFIETNGFFSFTKIYILQLEEFSILFCYFLMYFYCKILNCNYFEAFQRKSVSFDILLIFWNSFSFFQK